MAAERDDAPERPARPRTARTDLGPAGFPTKYEVVITNARTDESRHYIQTELAIDGEAKLIGLVEQIGARLVEQDFPWETLGKLFSEEGQAALDWATIGPDVTTILRIVSTTGPDVMVDAACIFFGVHQFDEDNKPNPDWETERKFIRSSLTFSRWVDLVRTFMAQNDYGRLAAPFGQALATGAQMGIKQPR
jgi:hypothetical protein